MCLQEYTVEVKLLDMCWDLRRRFSDFRKLHSSLEGCLDEKGAWPRTGPAAASRLRTAPAARDCARECGRALPPRQARRSSCLQSRAADCSATWSLSS